MREWINLVENMSLSNSNGLTDELASSNEEGMITEKKFGAALAAGAALAMSIPSANAADNISAPTAVAASATTPTQQAVSGIPSFQVVQDVQGEAARNIKYSKDSDDIWQVAGRRGDCEDIVLWKRLELLDRGFKPDDLQVLVLVRQKGAKKAGGVIEGHVVLRVVPYNVVMDNATRFPVDYEKYMKDNEFNRVCEVDNFSPKMRVQDRCKKKKTP